MTIKRLLVANRGEIACRIIRSARNLGIATVAVHTAPDNASLHVEIADDAVSLRGGPVQGYLDVVQIVEAAKQSLADAIHPGYGFLSESPKLAHRCAAQGLTFVGPSVTAMRQAGSKTRARIAAVKAQIPVLPGFDVRNATWAKIRSAATKIGYPLLVKASGGGGGRGIRVVKGPPDLKDALAQARREAQSGFGDDAVFLERQLVAARHIEVQVLGDTHGNVVVLGDRDCSLQRRRQKVLEEAPAPGLTSRLRDELHADAIRLAQAFGYANAGTVEFLVTGRERFFLEMNARLQVEHPVTEMTGALDLVEWQLRIASGEKLPDNLVSPPQGHAMEVRICAETPERNFAAAVGQISKIAWPATVGVRVDAGVRVGDTVGSQFDSLIAKLIVHSPAGRAACLQGLREAMGRFELAGVGSNLALLAAITDLAELQDAATRTNTLDRQLAALVQQALAKRHCAGALACAAWVNPGVRDSLHGFRVNLPPQTRLVLRDEYATTAVSILAQDAGALLLGGLGDEQQMVEQLQVAGNRIEAQVNGKLLQAEMLGKSDNSLTLSHGAVAFTFSFVGDVSPLPATEPSLDASADTILAPMHGSLLAWKVRRGQRVGKGDVVALIEAMKMETEVAASNEGTVTELCVAAGDQVAAGEVLAKFAKK